MPDDDDGPSSAQEEQEERRESRADSATSGQGSQTILEGGRGRQPGSKETRESGTHSAFGFSLFNHRGAAHGGQVMDAQSTGAQSRESNVQSIQQQVNMFADADAMRDWIHENIDKKDYDVAQFYHETGIAQAIARNSKFGTITLSVIGLNAVWIGLDAECNDARFEYLEGCPFQPGDKDFWEAGENLFCSFFTFELLVRFGAFRRKRDCCRDYWFQFDSALVFLMVLETWALPLLFGDSMSSMKDFALLKILRLFRLTRMVRLMRSVPELVTLLKGMVIAMRSLSYTMLLLLIFLYVFSIIFKSQLVDADEELRQHFSTMPLSMWTLMLSGCLLDNIHHIGTLLMNHNFAMGALFIMFVLMSSLMILNMLIGVLCAVVTAVAAAEKEKALVNYVKSKLIMVLERLDEDKNGTISKEEFDQLVHIPEAVSALDDLGVDIANLVSLADHLFDVDEDEDIDKKEGQHHSMIEVEDSVEGQSAGSKDQDSSKASAEGKSMTFGDFLEMVIRLRSENTPSVADIVDLRKLISKGQKQLNGRLGEIEKSQLGLERKMRELYVQLDSALVLAQEDESLHGNIQTEEINIAV